MMLFLITSYLCDPFVGYVIFCDYEVHYGYMVWLTFFLNIMHGHIT